MVGASSSSSPPTLSLGHLDLLTPLGRGGMGDVWRGYHQKLSLPVAVKVMRTPDPRHRAAFRNEIRAVSALSHPYIISVIERGQISAREEAASGGRIAAGSPYFAMELAEGTIAPRCGRMRWQAVRRVLAALLSALGHAHARGLLHGDIKPGNVLTIGETVKLTDFGLARRLDTPKAQKTTMGTPRYMAPEQAVDRWREVGPWTDLYALGRLTEALVYGQPGIARPDDAPWTPLPEGFLSWLSRLVAPEPADRFQRAADAAYALSRLPAPLPTDRALPPGPSPSLVQHTLPLEEMSVTHAGQTWDSGLDATPIPAAPLPAALGPRPRPPLHRHWADELLTHRPSRMGLSLLGLRSTPSLGRSDEQDALWQSLHAVDAGALQICVIKGRAGTGKRRLSHWLAERAHEVGAATVLTVRHTERSNGELGRMIASSLGCVGLSRAEAAAKIEAQLRREGVTAAYEWQALLELFMPSEAQKVPRSAEQYALILRHLKRLAHSQGRPVILQVEDGQWGSEALALVTHFARARRPPPVLVVITWASVPDRPLERAQLQGLLRHRSVRELNLEPLDEDAMYQLAHESFGLKAELAERVAARTLGLPMFTTQLVQHWAERGLLEQTPEGLDAAPNATLTIPASLQALWLARIDHALAGRGVDDAAALELTAVLDGPVVPDEWTLACAREGLNVQPGLVEVLLERGLVRYPEEGPEAGWNLTHWTLREALEHRAAAAGRMRAHHRACAWLIAEREDPTLALRLARHLVDAGEDEAALQPMLLAARRLAFRGAYRQGIALMATRAAAMDRLRLSAGHPARIAGQLLSSHFAQVTRNLERAEALAQQSMIAERAADRVKALQQLGRIRREQGRLVEARSLIQQAQSQAEQLDTPRLLAQCHSDQGSILHLEGALERAEAAFLRALDGYRRVHDKKGTANTHRELGRLYTRQERWSNATEHIEQARWIFHDLHDRMGESACLNALGEIARLQGRLAEAERRYRETLEGLRGTAQLAESIAEINLALVRVERGNYIAADKVLRAEQERCEQIGQMGTAGLLHAYRLPGLVAFGDWMGAQRAAERALALAEKSAVRDNDAARFAARAGQEARRAGQPDIAHLIEAVASWHRP
ncbi:MAG: protein kinase [Myxococcota bacterium]